MKRIWVVPRTSLQLVLLERGSHISVTYDGFVAEDFADGHIVLTVITMGRMISAETKGVQQRFES